MLRLIVNKARLHYNKGLEFAERNHLDDAILELNNALELDGSMANAHVVLGTLYAKKEQFDEARICWEKALALDHRFQKAHEYLHKAEKAEYVFPALKRLTMVIRVLGATTLVLLVIGVLLATALWRPDPDLRQVRESVRLLKTGGPSTGEGERMLSELVDKKNISPLAGELARGIQSNIQRGWQERLALATNAISTNNFLFALQITDGMNEERPREAIMQPVRRIRNNASRGMMQQISEDSEKFLAGKLPFEKFRDDTQHFLGYVQAGPYQVEASQLLAKATAVHHERMLAEASAAISKAPLAEAAQLVVNWQSRDPKLATPLRQLLEQRLNAETARLQGQIDALLNQGEADQARQKLEELVLLYQTVQRQAPADVTDPFKKRIASVRQTTALTAAQRAYDGKQWAQYLELTGNVSQLTADPVEQARLTAQRGEARKAYASEMWDWYQKRDTAYETGRISLDEATRTAKTYEATMKHLPAGLTYARGPILFYAAAAYARLDDKAKARELIGQLEKEYPKSYAVKSAKELKRRLNGQKAAKDQPVAQPAQPQKNQKKKKSS